MIKEFKEFISRGNVIDLSVGVIVGGAFAKITTSLVNDVLMPAIGVLLGGLDFTSLSIKIKDASVNYGIFLQNVIDFIIVSFCIFLLVKIVNKITKNKKKEEVKKQVPITKPEDIKLLEEIRDLLKDGKLKKNNKN